MFAIQCYGFPDYPFTHFKEGYKRKAAAKKAAAAALAEGWRMVEVLKRETLIDVGTQMEWVDWKVIETIEKEE